jgi:anti-sigma regulatory factor (Ser/Thr protein kinase)
MTATDHPPDRSFRHEAFLYSGDAEFLDGTMSFIRAGIERDDALFVIVDAPKIDLLRCGLGDTASSVEFADMQEVGRNPALVLQAWRDFAGDHAQSGRSLRGIGEPAALWRNAAQLAECHVHEAVMNSAFEPQLDFWLLCPYDTAVLAASDLARAVETHPYVSDDRGPVAHDVSHIDAADLLAAELATPPSGAETIPFGAESIHVLRKAVAQRAHAAGVDDQGVAGLVLAVSEIATNSIVHGHGAGSARLWISDGTFLCELHGPGRISDPMVGRLRPQKGQMHGYGIWLANQLCDLVQIRSCDAGTTVRLHLAREPRGS